MDITLPLIGVLSYFWQGTVPDDYHYINVVIRLPDNSREFCRISRQQVAQFIDDYVNEGHWGSLFLWLKVHLGHRSWFLNELLDQLVQGSANDSLLESNIDLFEEITSQLHRILEDQGNHFDIELELFWLNHKLNIVEVPVNQQKENKQQPEKQTTQQSSTPSSSSALKNSAAMGSSATGSSDNGASPPPPCNHSYNTLPCAACNKDYCELAQPDDSSNPLQQVEAMSIGPADESLIFSNWLRLINTYSSRGVIARVFLRPENSVFCMLSGIQSPGTFLFPGANTALFSSDRCRVSGVILSPVTPLAARFKNNAFTKRVIGGDYNSLKKFNGLDFFKNHANHFSFLLKMFEQYIFFNTCKVSGKPGFFYSSGHITETGDFKQGKLKYIINSYDQLAHNEVIIQWDDWEKHILGFFITCPSATDKAVDTIRALMDARPHNHLLGLLPVVFYKKHHAGFSFISSAQSFLENPSSTYNHWRSDLLPEIAFRDNLSETGLLNPEGFTFYIDHMARVIRALSFPKEVAAGTLSIRQGTSLMQVFRVSYNRQLLESVGAAFTEEEALLLAYCATIPEARPETPQSLSDSLDLLARLFLINGASPSVVEGLRLAMTVLLNPNVSESDARARGSGTRWGIYLYLLKTRLSGDLSLPYPLINEVNQHQFSQLLITRKRFDQIIDQTILSTRISINYHGWPLLLNEFRAVIPCKVIRQLRNEGYQIQPWPYAEIMASIPGTLNLLDQIEAAGADGSSPYVTWLHDYFVRVGLPLHPGTLRNGFMTYATVEQLRQQLAKRPSEQHINAIQSNYPVQSRNWENACDPVWREDPLTGLDTAMKK